jgi:RecB family exonuclease
MPPIEVILGATQQDRESALLAALERAYDAVSRTLDALLLVPTRRRAQALREAAVAHFGGRCWVPQVETFEELFLRHAAPLSGATRPLEELGRLLLVEELLEGAGLVGTDRVPRGVARRVAEALDAFQAALAESVEETEDLAAAMRPVAPESARRLAAFARRYIGVLRRQELADRGELARLVLRAWQEEGCPERAQMLVMDGFVRLRPVERAAVEAMVGGFSEVVATLAVPSADVASLASHPGFAAAAGLCAWLRGLGAHFSHAEPAPVSWRADPTAGPTPREVAERSFLRDVVPLRPGEGPEAAFRLLRLPSRREELRFVARSIRLALVSSSTDPTDLRPFTVVVSDLSTYQDIVREVFTEYGLAWNMARGVPLATAPSVRVMHKVLVSLTPSSHGWRPDDLWDVLSYAATIPDPDDLPQAMARLLGVLPARTSTGGSELAAFVDEVRRAGINDPFDAAQWFRRLATYHQYVSAYDPDEEHAPDQRERAPRTPSPPEGYARNICVVDDFVRRVRRLGGQHSPADFRDALLDLIRRYGLVSRTFPPADEDPDAEREFSAWRAFVDLLDRMVLTFDALRQATGRRATGPMFAEYLCQAITDPETQCYPPQPDNGVAVLSLAQTQAMRFRHLFLVGLVEGEVPSPARHNFLLHPDRTSSLPEVLAELDSLPRERFLFRDALMNAERAVLTYPLMEQGRELVPSPFLEEVRAAFGLGYDEQIAPLATPETTPLLSGREALVRMGESDNARGAEALSLPAENVATLLRVERERRRTDSWSRYDGYLTDDSPETDAQLRAIAARPISVTQLDEYAACPIRFFFRRVLRVRGVEAYEEEIAPHVRGQALHAILEEFARRLPWPLDRDGAKAEALRHMREAAETVLARYDALYPNLYWEVERKRLLSGLGEGDEPPGILRAFVDAEFDLATRPVRGDYRPGAFVEVWVGGRSGRSRAQNIGAYALPRLDGDGDIHVEGRIDRVDVEEATGRYVVYDYKSGSAPSVRDAFRGLRFQLPVYLDAVSGALPGCREGVGGAFWVLKEARNVGRQEPIFAREHLADGEKNSRRTGYLTAEAFSRFRESVRENIRQMDAHIRAGRFHWTIHDEGTAGCLFCDYREICRLDPSRREELRSDQPHYGPIPFDPADASREPGAVAVEDI